MPLADLLGRTFGRLTVTGPRIEGTTTARTRWPVLCACGIRKTARHYDLLCGDATSCGCLKRELAATSLLRHGHASRAEKRAGYSAEYRVWMAMRARCNNPKTDYFHRYGGRGIRIDPRWDDFAQFLRDMGPRPSPHHTIERREVDGHYSPENCFWLPREKQALNTSRTRSLTCRGRTQTLAEWSRESGRPMTTIYQRIKRGWSVEDAVFGAPRW